MTQLTTTPGTGMTLGPELDQAIKERVEAYARKHYTFPAVFIEQAVQDGTAGAVALARPYVDEPVLIIFVDTIFDADLSVLRTIEADGIIWTKEVEDYQRFVALYRLQQAMQAA